MNLVEVRELRRHVRFLLEEPLAGTFGATPVAILNISGGGLQIEHAEPLKVGSHASVRLAVRLMNEETMFPASIVWSKLSTTTDPHGKHLYRSGMCIAQAHDSTYGFLGRLIRTAGRLDADSLERKRLAMVERQKTRGIHPHPPQTKPKYTPEQLLLIEQARERLAAHPDDQTKFYESAKLSLAEKKVPVLYKRDVLAVWKYLCEAMDLDLIATVVSVAQPA